MTNWNFEIYSSCPPYAGGIKRAVGWDSARGSPDYFNTCATYTTWVSVPFNAVGYQSDCAGGGAYAGFCAYNGGFPNDGREYMQTQLIDTLILFHKYVATAHVNLSNYSGYAVASIGMFFTTNPIGGPPNLGFINVPNPQVKGNFPFTDTLNWMAVQDTFVSQGGELYLTIGNFSYDSLSDTLYLHPGVNGSYYYIDSVTVFDTGLMGVLELGIKNEEFRIFPNPNNGDFQISYDLKENSWLEIRDLQGRLVKRDDLPVTQNQAYIHCEDLENGLYFCTVVSGSLESFQKKLIIVK